MIRQHPGSQSGQAVLIGVIAFMLLAASIAAGLQYTGAKGLLGRQQAGTYQTSAVQKALHAFVARSFRLPCPADGSLATSDAKYGLEQTTTSGTTCTVNTSKGVVPWKTLGISYQDSLDKFGQQLGYAVSPQLAAPLYIPTSQISFLSTPKATLDNYNKVIVQTCVATCATTATYAYVVISYGKDHSAAYGQSGTRNALPSATLVRETPNTLDTAYGGSTGFNVWGYNDLQTAGANYFDDVLIYEKASDLVNDLNFANNNEDNKDAGGTTYGNPNSSTSAPANAGQNSSAAAQATNPGTITNTYSCAAGSTFCPGSTNSGSLANTYSYSSCSGNSCTALNAGECLYIVGSLGVVCVHDPIYNSGISVGNQLENGDWVGPNHANSCPQCSVPGTPNYMVPTQTLTYNLVNTYKSFAFVDYLVDGGQQVQVDAYQSPVTTITGDISGLTIDSASSTAGLQIGQTVISSYFPDFSYITNISGTQLTMSAAASGSQTDTSISFIQSAFYLSGSVTAGDAEVDGVAVSLNNASVPIATAQQAISVGDAITGPNIQAGTTITGVNLSTSDSLSLSLPTLGTGTTNANLMFVTPWTKVGTRILSNGYKTNMNNALTITGITTANQLSMTSVSPAGDLAIGQLITGPGLSPSTTIASLVTDLTGTTVVLSQVPVGGTNPASGTFYVATGNMATAPVTGDLNGTTTVTNVSSTTGITAGQAVSGAGIQAGTTVATVGASSLTLSQAATLTQTGSTLFFTTRLPVTGITGDISLNSTTIANVSSSNGLTLNDHIDSPALPSGTYITNIGSAVPLSISVSQSATATQAGAILAVIPINTSVNITGDLTQNSKTISNVPATSIPGLITGDVIAASSGLSSGTYITSVGTTSLTISQAPSVSLSGQTLTVVKGTPVIGTTGDITNGSSSIANLSSTTGLSVGQFIANINLQDQSLATGLSGTSLTISKVATGTELSASITSGYYPPASTITTTGTLVGSTAVTSLPALALPGLGSVINGVGIPGGTISTALSGTDQMTISQSANLSTTSTLYSSYAVCPGPQTSLGGLYAAPNDERGATTQFAPIVQHPPASVASQLASQIWPEPGTAGSGTNSAGSSPDGLSGNYIDQRDNQFSNLQFTDGSGNAVNFNILVFQVLPYVYSNGQTCAASGTAECQYGMLFEGAQGCYTDANSARCTMQGIDEWWNPPVQVTMDCGQYPQ